MILRSTPSGLISAFCEWNRDRLVTNFARVEAPFAKLLECGLIKQRSRKIDPQHLSVAISDFGIGIAAVVKTRLIRMRNVNSPDPDPVTFLEKGVVVIMLGSRP